MRGGTISDAKKSGIDTRGGTDAMWCISLGSFVSISASFGRQSRACRSNSDRLCSAWFWAPWFVDFTWAKVVVWDFEATWCWPLNFVFSDPFAGIASIHRGGGCVVFAVLVRYLFGHRFGCQFSYCFVEVWTL